MEIIKNEYKIEKCKDDFCKKYGSYLITKTIFYDNGNTEERTRMFFPHLEGEIEKVNLDNLEFKKPITHEEFKQMPLEYQRNWCGIKCGK